MTKTTTVVRNYGDEFLQCRGFEPHHWTETTALDDTFRSAPWGVRIVEECAKCTTVRHALLDPRTGAFIRGSHWSYRPAEGYRISGLGRIPQQTFRAEVFRRRREGLKAKLTIKQGGNQTVKKVKRSRKAA